MTDREVRVRLGPPPWRPSAAAAACIDHNRDDPIGARAPPQRVIDTVSSSPGLSSGSSVVSGAAAAAVHALAVSPCDSVGVELRGGSVGGQARYRTRTRRRWHWHYSIFAALSFCQCAQALRTRRLVTRTPDTILRAGVAATAAAAGADRDRGRAPGLPPRYESSSRPRRQYPAYVGPEFNKFTVA